MGDGLPRFWVGVVKLLFTFFILKIVDFIQPFPTEIYATTIPIPTIPKLYPVNLSLTLTPITTKLTRKHLNTGGACILDAGDEVWVWIGKACDNEIRGVVNEALAVNKKYIYNIIFFLNF